MAKQNKTGNADPDFEAPLDDDSDEEDKKTPSPPPIPVFADIECYQDEDRVFHANAGLAPKRTKFITPTRLKIFWRLWKN